MNDIPATNPLASYFRVPGLHVTLPTKGAFFPEGGVSFTADQAVPVLPMRAADELLLKNPDALMSGHAIERLIESCVPAIHMPRLISAPDLDVILLAIRAATYGDTMEIQAGCPKCQHVNTFDCHLPTILQSTKEIGDNSVRLSDDLVAYLRPYNLQNTTELSLATFEETRKVQALQMNEEATQAQRTAQMNQSMERLAKLTTNLMASCVIKIVTPTGAVTEQNYIREFFANTSRAFAEKIEAKLTELNNGGIDKTMRVQCERKDCGHEWETMVEFDPSSFFESGS